MPPRLAPGRGAGPRGGPTRGGGAGRGGIRVAIAAQQGHQVETIGVRRPGFGTGGKTVNTIVNAFEITIPDNTIYHYDVVVASEKLPARVNMLLFDRLQKVVKPDVFTRSAVYDGRKNAFTTYRLPLGPNDSAEFNVTMERQGPPSQSSRPPKVYPIKLTKVAEINTEILHRFIDGKVSQDNAVTTSLTALNVAIRMEPNLRFPFNSRSFFTEDGRTRIGAGIELWRGYFQSIRPSQAKMYLNVDVATGMMFKEGPLIQLCLEYLKLPGNETKRLTPQRRPNDGGLSDRDRLSLQRFVTNLRVSTSYGGHTKALTIKKLTREGANASMFTKREGGPSISVANYFRNELNRPLKFPDLICIEVGSGAIIPLELCTVPAGQFMKKQIPADKTNDVVKFSKLKPEERLAKIRQGLTVLAHGQSDYVREFGMAVDPNPMVVKARVIAPPTLRYGQGSKQATISPFNGKWNMTDKKLFRPQVIKNWIIVIYENQARFQTHTPESIAAAFCRGAESVGMKVADREPLIFWENGHGNIPEQLKKNGLTCLQQKQQPPDLIVVILPEGGNHIYTAVKHFGDILMGVATQCLKFSKCGNANMQYWANVMLKVNVKLGGINNILENSSLNDPVKPTIVMGADVMHPAPGAVGRPSFASLVSSVDLTTAKYISCSRLQTGRQEMIDDLEDMVKEVLISYIGYAKTFDQGKKAPARLIFYRDGVSEPQFKHVLEFELPKIKAACKAVNLAPKITLIVVGKRHHIRMFPQNRGDADGSGNCKAGTTIDEGLGHPTEFDYYQLTHGGLIGTSRPAHYSVIYDENQFSADGMQNLSFSLCHVYARATTSVSIPAPVYYADIVCSRAKHHYAPGGDLDFSETATQASSHAESQLEIYRAGYKPLHAKQTRLMYFM